jgi:quercetin dioxygenase-like cupin family protein
LDAIAPQLLAVGYLARALHGQNVTMAIVEIDPGAELPEHRHENEQLGLVIEGLGALSGRGGGTNPWPR